MAFLLNPYNNFLNLTNRDDRKLFQDACKGLEDDDTFSGKKVEYNDFAKLIVKSSDGDATNSYNLGHSQRRRGIAEIANRGGNDWLI